MDLAVVACDQVLILCGQKDTDCDSPLSGGMPVLQ